MRDERILTREEARDHWTTLTRKLPFWVRGTVLSMGLPAARECTQDNALPHEDTSEPEHAANDDTLTQGRPAMLPDTHAVRDALARDAQLNADVLAELGRAYWSAVECGEIPTRIPSPALPAWAYRVAQRATWRFATRRARHLMREVPASAPGHGHDYDGHPSDAPSAEDLLYDQEARHLMQLLLQALPADKRDALLAKMNGTYAELSAATGEAEETLRKRAERTLKEIAGAVKKRLGD